MAGYACEDEKLVNLALYGEGGTAQKPTGGIFGTHFTNKCIFDDGLWNEGAPGYQLGIASCALFNDAETLWHHGIDLYRHNNGALKRLLDSAIALAYPDDKLTVAALHDSGRQPLLSDQAWLNNEISVPYACGYRRYGDARYIPIIRNASQKLSMTIHAGPPSLFPELPEAQAAPAPSIEPANFYSVGYGVQRLATAHGPNQVILEYGPSGSHGHPSKLGIDLYALGDAIIPFPGVIYPYNDPMDPKWYWTTLGNCALTVDEKSQVTWGLLYKYPRGTPNPEGRQLLFAPARTMSMQRAWSDNLYIQRIAQDRALFLTPQYLADLYGAFADSPHQYDMAWHFRGQLTPSLRMDPMRFPEPVADGYNALTDVSHARTDKAWSCSITTPNKKSVYLVVPGGVATEVITGKGHFFTRSAREDEQPPTVIQRRTQTNSTIFGNAVDISGDETPYVKSVIQEGGLDAGYALLRIQTAKGTDLCFAAYRTGSHRADPLQTDAQQAMVLMDGGSVRAMYLGGGRTLKVDGAQITRSESGLAYVEKLADGTYVVGNPSAGDATVTVVLPAAGTKPFTATLKGGSTVPLR